MYNENMGWVHALSPKEVLPKQQVVFGVWNHDLP